MSSNTVSITRGILELARDSLDDVPFDMKHHRVLKYLPNAEGMQNLQAGLAKKLAQVSA